MNEKNTGRRPAALQFPADFIWGSATAAFQIEGALNRDGRGPSIWDDFCRRPGAIADGSDASIACDHYQYWQRDLALMAELGLQAYRFSIAWPRLLPEGRGTANAAGIGFYDRLIDGLLEKNIQPMATLFHWDLPLALQEQGGFAGRDCAEAFADYADLATRRFGDRVKTWFTLNEPNIFAFNGHLLGIHAPGIRDPDTYFRVAHHLNLAHGQGVRRVRDNVSGGRVGLVMHQALFESIELDAAGAQAVEYSDQAFNRLFLDPVLRGEYPPLLRDTMAPLAADGDAEIIATPTDFLGVNHYTRYWVRPDPQVPSGVSTEMDHRIAGARYTDMGWEIYPEGLYRVLTRLYEDYRLPLLVTENGCALDDHPQAGGGTPRVADPARIDFLDRYLRALHRAIGDGCPVLGYLQWSFLDNFEWAEGLQKRFGLVYVDYASGERIVKDSGYWYRDLIARNGLEPADDQPA